MKNTVLKSALLVIGLLWVTMSHAESPTSVSMAAILTVGPDEAWDGTFLDSWERLRKAKPNGLELNEPVYSEAVFGNSAEAAMRLYARKYDIVWAHSAYSDQVKRIQKKYPDTLFVVVGSGNEGHGGNQYWVYNRVHEPAYVLGVVAAMRTKSNVLGAVAGFSTDDINDIINAFFEGAKSIKPDITHKVAYIDSWWDPPMAFEASKAQMAASADQILMLSGAFEACKDFKATCYANYRDWYEFAPDAIGGSAVTNWEPHIRWIIDEWFKAKSSGQAFNGNKEKKWFSMADGAASVALGKYPHSDAIKAKVEELVQQIKSGEFEVPLITSAPKSN